MPNDQTLPDTWAIVELMGHVRLAGKLSEEEKFGAKMGRLDIPTEKPCDACAGDGHVAFMQSTPCPSCKGAKVERGFITQYFGGGSVYRISLVSEDVARHVARTGNVAPVNSWDFPQRALPAPIPTPDSGYERQHRDDDKYEDHEDMD